MVGGVIPILEKVSEQRDLNEVHNSAELVVDLCLSPKVGAQLGPASNQVVQSNGSDSISCWPCSGSVDKAQISESSHSVQQGAGIGGVGSVPNSQFQVGNVIMETVL